jgi:hypothetical protein
MISDLLHNQWELNLLPREIKTMERKELMLYVLKLRERIAAMQIEEYQERSDRMARRSDESSDCYDDERKMRDMERYERWKEERQEAEGT